MHQKSGLYITMTRWGLTYLFIAFQVLSWGQSSTVNFRFVDYNTLEAVEYVRVYQLESGKLTELDSLNEVQLTLDKTPCTLVFSAPLYKVDTITLNTSNKTNYTIKLKTQSTQLGLLTIGDKDHYSMGYASLRGVDTDNMAVYKGMKTNDVAVDLIAANKSTNNARELYSQVAGINVWESDGAGIQLGIGGRGLSPDRSANFNVRQNGYDISADALGYPESYYSPPSEAVGNIQVIRGAASLQYGTQFGGLVNFKLKSPYESEKFGLHSRTSLGSNNYLANFTQFGGRVGVNAYNVFVNYKQGDDFRPNSGFNQVSAHISYKRLLSESSLINVEFTKMAYLAQQAGGLTDIQFYDDPYQSNRERNWFKVNWNLASINFKSKLSKTSMIDVKAFGLVANRNSLGTLLRIDRADDDSNRNLIQGDFKNIGLESRMINWYGNSKRPHTLVAGVRLYKGQNTAFQGAANNGSDADFTFINSDSLSSDYLFPSHNLALFAQNIFQLTKRLSIVPGVRYEYISTKSDGYYRIVNRDLAGNVIEQRIVNETQVNNRGLFLAGTGLSYQVNDNTEIFANISQNYRAITFNDMRIVNPNFQIDPELQDETGYTGDIGVRGKIKELFTYDISGFYIYYNNRIGFTTEVNEQLNRLYILRTNVGSSRNLGLESYINFHVDKIWSDSSKFKIILFSNVSIIDARYIDSKEQNIEGNYVELAPPLLMRFGLSVGQKNWGISWTYSFTDRQFSDASNAISTPTAVNGVIPSYSVQDINAFVNYKRFRFELSVNNLLDEAYFTRRASGYPGPGIIPSPGRLIFGTLQFKL